MRRLETDVVVIGGGATGAGAVRDAAMRGYRTILLDRADLGQGTTGRYHGLLHSGGRYVVSDANSAAECARENEIVTRIHADAVEACGGLFVVCPDDDPAFGDKWLEGAKAAGMPHAEISVAEALRREPLLNKGMTRAFEVADGSVDGWQMVWGAANSAKEHGAQILTYHMVTDIVVENGQVTSVLCRNMRTGEDLVIDCGFVINAAGPWAGKVAAMAGCTDVDVVPGRGIMIAMNHRLVNRVVNRCIPPSDGDILVPVHTVSIIGTTDVRAEDADKLTIPRDEVQQMLDSGEVLIPGFRNFRAVHAWSGARPLFKDSRVAATDTRHMSRGMSILDHGTRDDVKGIVSIIGGKLTTYRLMAEHVVDAMEDQTGNHHECRTATEAVPGSTPGKTYLVTHRLEEREENRLDDQTLCECELMGKSAFKKLLKENPTATFDDLRRQLRLGMGPCQGGFCALRATGTAVEAGTVDAARATSLFQLFLKNRWGGLWPILYGDQVRQTALDSWIFQGLYDVSHLPEGATIEGEL